MELVGNPVHPTDDKQQRSGVGVLLDVESDEQREPPFVRPPASCRFTHSPLVRLLGYALVLALAAPVSARDASIDGGPESVRPESAGVHGRLHRGAR